MSEPEDEGSDRNGTAPGRGRLNRRSLLAAGALVAAGAATAPFAAPPAFAAPAAAEPGNGHGSVTTYPAPSQVAASAYHTVWVNGRSSFAYQVNTHQRTADSAKGPASYTSFDFTGAVTVRVQVPGGVTHGTVTPQRYGIRASVSGGSLYFTISQPGQYTVEVNGSADHPLHVFANAPETDVPDPSDPDVIYYGPGYHEVGSLSVPSGTTLYLAGGAYLHATKSAADNPQWSSFFEKDTYDPVITVSGASDVTIRGRGIIDLSGLLWGEKDGIEIQNSSNVQVEGVILHQTVHEGVAAHNCDGITIENVKVIGKEENTDAISFQGARNSTIRGCFARAQDDVIYVNASSGTSYGDTVEDCVVWADRTHALGVVYSSGYEIHDVVFRNCDVLHSYGYDPTYDIALTVFTNDDQPVHDILFDSVTVEQARYAFIQVEVTANSTSPISNITFRNVRYTGPATVGSFLSGRSATSAVDGVLLDQVYYQGKPVTDPASANFSLNPYTSNVRSDSGTWAAPDPVAGQTYRLVNRNSGKVAQVAGASTWWGGPNIEQWEYQAQPHQQWLLVDLGGGLFQIQNVNSGYAMAGVTASGVPTEDGANIDQWMYAHRPEQQWRIISRGDGYVTLLNADSGKVADIADASTADGGNVQQWQYQGKPSQQWSLTAP